MKITDRFRSSEYATGVKDFITLARSHSTSDEIRCPCTLCSNNYFLPISQVERHLFIKGIEPTYTTWIFHGEEEDLPFIDDDDLHDPEQADPYIDDIDVMLQDHIDYCYLLHHPLIALVLYMVWMYSHKYFHAGQCITCL